MADQRPVKTIPEMSPSTDTLDDDLLIQYTDSIATEQKTTWAAFKDRVKAFLGTAAQLQSEDVVQTIDDITGFFGLTGVDGQQVSLTSWRQGWAVTGDGLPHGGGRFVYSSSFDRTTDHDGGVGISPDVQLAGFDSASIAAYLSGSGTGTGGWKRMFNGAINPEWFSYIADESGGIGTDNSASIQASDNAAVSNGVFQVEFPSSDKNALVGSTIVKSDATLWSMIGSNSFSNGLPKGLFFTNNGIGVRVVPDTQTTYYGSAGFKNIGFSTGEANSSAIGIEYAISATPGAARENVFSEVKLTGFALANIKINGGGTYYFDRVYSYRSEKSLWLSSTSDSWFYACHFGSGKGYSNPNAAQTYGVYGIGCDNLTFIACRFQEGLNGLGARMEGLERSAFTDCFFDGNELGGMDLQNFHLITINGCRFFRNGTAGSKKYGLLAFSASAGDATQLSVVNSKFFDQDFGGPSEVQDKGISFLNNGNSLSDIQVVACDFEEVTTPLANLSLATEVIVESCGKSTIPRFRTQGDANLGWTYGTHGHNIRQNVTLTADRTITLNIGAVPTDYEVVVTRTSGGAFNLNINTVTGPTLLKSLSTNEWAKFKYNGTDWEFTQFGTL